MYSIYGYIFRDGCEILCGECAFNDLEALSDEGKLSRTLRAAVKLARMRDGDAADPESVSRVIEQASCHHWSWNNYGSKERADHITEAGAELNGELSTLFEDGSESQGGEWCGGCSKELVEPWADCLACGRDGNLSELGGGPWAITDDGNGSALTVVCESCATEWRDTVNSAGAGITEAEWETMRQATDIHYGRWNDDHPRLSLTAADVTEHPANEWRKPWTTTEYRWAPGRVLRPLRWQRLEEAGQGVLAIAV